MEHLHVAHENKDYIVINKTAGLISEKNPYENTAVEDQVFAHLSKTDSKPFTGVIDRLDRVTSGALVFAKKKAFWWYLTCRLVAVRFEKPISPW